MWESLSCEALCCGVGRNDLLKIKTSRDRDRAVKYRNKTEMIEEVNIDTKCGNKIKGCVLWGLGLLLHPSSCVAALRGSGSGFGSSSSQQNVI